MGSWTLMRGGRSPPYWTVVRMAAAHQPAWKHFSTWQVSSAVWVGAVEGTCVSAQLKGRFCSVMCQTCKAHTRSYSQKKIWSRLRTWGSMPICLIPGSRLVSFPVTETLNLTCHGVWELWWRFRNSCSLGVHNGVCLSWELQVFCDFTALSHLRCSLSNLIVVKMTITLSFRGYDKLTTVSDTWWHYQGLSGHLWLFLTVLCNGIHLLYFCKITIKLVYCFYYICMWF